MGRIYLLLSMVLFAQCKSADRQAPDTGNKTAATPRRVYDYCYSNKSGIFVFTAGDRVGRRLSLHGNDVQLSPDGTMLAYTELDSANRRIGLMDLTTGRNTILDSVCRNCYGPVWSPDEKWLVYNAFVRSRWKIKYVGTGDGHVDFIGGAGDLSHEYFAPSWTPDSKRVIVQDMSAVYIMDLKGAILQKIPFADIDTTITGNSAMSFLFTPKEDKLIYWCGKSTDTVLAPHSDETPSYIFSYDLKSKKATQLTMGRYNCYDPVLRGDTIFCQGHDPRDDRGISNVYRLNMDGSGFGIAFKNCRYFSCRTK